jgi:hypothetical protein
MQPDTFTRIYTPWAPVRIQVEDDRRPNATMESWIGNLVDTTISSYNLPHRMGHFGPTGKSFWTSSLQDPLPLDFGATIGQAREVQPNPKPHGNMEQGLCSPVPPPPLHGNMPLYRVLQQTGQVVGSFV